jgi:hypothetical protein
MGLAPMNKFQSLLFSAAIVFFSCPQSGNAEEPLHDDTAPICENSQSAVVTEIEALERAMCAFMRISELCAAQGEWRTEILRHETAWEITRFPPGDCRAWKVVIQSSNGAILSMTRVPLGANNSFKPTPLRGAA